MPVAVQSGEISIPSGEILSGASAMSYETLRFKTGILHFTKWRLDVPTLIEYFTYNMEKDNWKLINSFRGKESFSNFSKPDKTCTIKVTDRWYGTMLVEIRISPLGEKKM